MTVSGTGFWNRSKNLILHQQFDFLRGSDACATAGFASTVVSPVPYQWTGIGRRE